MNHVPTTYRILSRPHVNRWNEQLQQAIPGVELKVLWAATGTVLTVFVPDESYTPENVDTLIRQAGAVDDRIHALGG